MLVAMISIGAGRDAVQLRTNRTDVDERLGLAQPAHRGLGSGALEEPLVIGFDPRR